ncbi:DUF4179 domain-containing protein [Alicyclobacillus dauci]|uniref:DUF4179 domain-containing protein n=1 Tax=Alicyclobacillus dauci TaxID=1475485 RepID=A0ABY6YZQ1_9BACL|nr:hypothetical protein [Alicyclobacillus dauci]WAH36102.1 hypothetical protein NZD86_17900 [Alicyclobacillus dauci]
MMDKLDEQLKMSKQHVMTHTLELSQPLGFSTNTPKQPRRRKFAFLGLGAISAALLCGFGLPLIHVGKNFNLLSSQNNVSEVRIPVLQGYGEKVNQSVTSHGITLRIVNIYADPLRFEYDMIESFGKNAPSHPVIVDSDIHMTLNGNKTLYNFSGGDFQRTDAGGFAGTVFMPMMNVVPFTPLPANFTLDVHVSQIGNVEGNWNFSIPVSQAKMLNHSNVLSPHLAQTVGNKTFTIQDVTLAPDQTIIQATLSEPNQAKPEFPNNVFVPGEIGKILVTDSTGHLLTKNSVASNVFDRGLVGSPSSTIEDGKRIYHMTIAADKPSNSSTALHITPIVEGTTMALSLNGKFPVVMGRGSNKITVTGIQFLSDKTLVDITMNNETYDGQHMTEFSMTHKVPSAIVGTLASSVRVTNATKHQMVVTFPKMDSHQAYTIQAQRLNPLSQFAITVPLK